MLLTTGASDAYKKKNIYDMGGNLYEVVMTAQKISENSWADCSASAAFFSSSKLPYTDISAACGFGYCFRPSLYIK